jgi:hypothetical protein
MRSNTLSKISSWVIVENNTGNAIFETFNEALIKKLNLSKYKAMPILEYLQGLNNRIKADKH